MDEGLKYLFDLLGGGFVKNISEHIRDDDDLFFSERRGGYKAQVGEFCKFGEDHCALGFEFGQFVEEGG